MWTALSPLTCNDETRRNMPLAFLITQRSQVQILPPLP